MFKIAAKNCPLVLDLNYRGFGLSAHRPTLGLYATVRGDCWYDEERCKWLPISTFFSDRK